MSPFTFRTTFIRCSTVIQFLRIFIVSPLPLTAYVFIFSKSIVDCVVLFAFCCVCLVVRTLTPVRARGVVCWVVCVVLFLWCVVLRTFTPLRTRAVVCVVLCCVVLGMSSSSSLSHSSSPEWRLSWAQREHSQHYEHLSPIFLTFF